MNLTKEELRKLVLKELNEMEELDEGFFSRMRSAWAGGKAKGGAWGRNVGKLGTGGTMEDPRAAQAAAKSGKRFEIAAAKFEEMGKDLYKDLQQMEVSGEDPELQKEVQKLKGSLKAIVTRIRNVSTKIGGMQNPNAPAPTP
jgi:hypothetical protein